MVPVEFQASVKNGIIVVPDEYQQVIVDYDTVTVVVGKQSKKRISQTGMIAALIRNPVAMDQAVSLRASDSLRASSASRRARVVAASAR